jgi:hypothetical protein
MIFSDLSFTRIARERIAFSLDISTSIQRGEQLLGEAQKNVVNGPISGQREINPEHGQGQIACQKGSAMHWPLRRKGWISRSRNFNGRTVGVMALVGVMIEIQHLSCVRLTSPLGRLCGRGDIAA